MKMYCTFRNVWERTPDEMLDARLQRSISQVLALLNFNLRIHHLPVVRHCEDGIRSFESSEHASLGVHIALSHRICQRSIQTTFNFDFMLRRLTVTTSTPWLASFLDESFEASRVIPRIAHWELILESARIEFTTEPP